MKQIATDAFAAFRSGKGLKGQLLRGGVGSIAIKIASILAGLVSAILLARILGPEQFGIYSFVLALITLLTVPAQFGLPNLVVRETAKAQANEDWPRMRGVWRWSNLIALGSSALLIAGVLIYMALPGAQVMGGDPRVLLWALPLIPLLALGNLRGAALRGLRKVVQGQLPEHVLRPGLLIVLIGLAWLALDGTLDANRAIALNVTAAFIAFAIGAMILWKTRPREVTATSTTTYENRAWLMSAIPLALIAGMSQIMKQTDIVMLGFFTTPEDVGIYRVAVQGATIVTFALSAVNTIAGPYFARFHSQKDQRRIQILASTTALAIMFISLPILLGIIAYGEPIISLVFGTDYNHAALPLSILATAQLVNALTASSSALLMMTGHERETATIMMAIAVLNIVLNLLLIPSYGISGAASATATSIVLQNVSLWACTRRKLDIDTSPLGLLNFRRTKTASAKHPSQF